MDLGTVTELRRPTRREQLHDTAAGTAYLAGGTWLFGEPQPQLTTLVDLTCLNWPPLDVTADGDLEIAATCTIQTLVAAARGGDAARWPVHAHPSVAQLVTQCADAFLASWKIQRTSTVGGNLAAALPAGPMISLTAALDARVTVWRADGTDARLAVPDLVTGNHSTALAPGDVIRSITLPAAALAGRVAFRRSALAPLGRTGTLLIGRLAPADAVSDGFVLTVTGGTVKPVLLPSRGLPTAGALAARVETIDAWFTDAHGAADWRRAVSAVFAREIVDELRAPETGTGTGTGTGNEEPA